MKNFNWGGREMPFGQGYACLIKQNNRLRNRLLLSLGRYCIDVILTIFCVLFSGLLVSSAFGQEAKGPSKANSAQPRKYNYRLYDAVTNKPIISERYVNDALQRYPKADLVKFPMTEHLVDTTRLARIKVGELLPDEVLDLPLWVTNDAYGRDTITLRSEMDKEWLILDIWTENCPPCLKSLNILDRLAHEDDSNLVLMGVYTSWYTYKACIVTRKRGYRSVQILGPSMAVLKQLFLGSRTHLGPAIWIKDGRFFGVTNAAVLSEPEYRDILTGKITQIPAHAAYQNLR